MSANVKLGNNTLTGVDTIRLENADAAGEYVPFSLGMSGAYKVTFNVDGSAYTVVSVVAGESVQKPTAPNKTGYTFNGWWTAQTGGTQVTFPYTPVADTTFHAQFTAGATIGFTGLTNSSGNLAWTGAIAGAASWQKTTVGNNVTITSPLDNVFPFNRIEEFTDSSGNVFVKFPKCYIKFIYSGTAIDGFNVSSSNDGGDMFIPDCFLDPHDTTCSTYLDYFALGKYEASGSSSRMYSKTGQTCLVDITRAQGRTAARAYGTSSNYYNGYQMIDFSMLTLFNFLAMLYYKTGNIQTVMPGRTSDTSAGGQSWTSAASTGTTDGISALNGYNTAGDCVKILGVENPFGNVNKWIDGAYFSKGTIYAHRLPQYFADSTTNAVNLGFSRPTASGYISALRAGNAGGTISYVYCSVASGSAATYVGDHCHYLSIGVGLSSGGSWGSTAIAGLWSLYGDYTATSADTNVGARLAYRPL